MKYTNTLYESQCFTLLLKVLSLTEQQFRRTEAEYASFPTYVREKFPCELILNGFRETPNCKCWNCIVYNEIKKLMDEHFWIDDNHINEISEFQKTINELKGKASIKTRNDLIRKAETKVIHLKNLIEKYAEE